ncbi:MAG TPA: glycosyltransferase family 87 protein [Candidatus Acidoferrum sp.]|nr:glycosyltransferase family 87 protein [Candidatus Acidoferrum sp.]
MTRTGQADEHRLTAFRAIGVRRTVVLFVLVFTAIALAWIVRLRPDYLQPTQLGTDVGTYFAAGQRLLAGHDLYTLAPGDRPVPIWPPYWSVPLVGPPTTGVLWAPLAALLPPVLAIYAWWGAAFVATATVFVWLVVRGQAFVVIGAGLLSLSTIITALTGNVNGLLIGGFVAIWILAQGPPSTRRDVAIGIVIALATALKIGPAVFGIWLIATRRWRAVVATIVTGIIIGAVTILAAGPGVIGEYLRIASDTADAGVTSLSAGGILQSLGAPDALVKAAPLEVVALAGVIALGFRKHQGVAFSIVAVGATFAVPVVRFETLSMLLVAMAPWVRPRDGISPLARKVGAALASQGFRLVLDLTGIVLAAFIGGLILGTFAPARSSLYIANVGAAPVVVRVFFNDFAESFGFDVPAGASAWAWSPLDGGVSGPIATYDSSCRLTWHSEIRADGGSLTIGATGAAELTAPPAAAAVPSSVAHLAYTDACADAGSPGR